MMVHSVYSDRDVFLRELISNAADACERLRYEAIASPALLDRDSTFRITITIDPDKKTLTVEDNGIGINRDELVQALGTIAHSGTRAFLEKVEASQNNGTGATLIGQFGVGFYSASTAMPPAASMVVTRTVAGAAALGSPRRRGGIEQARAGSVRGPME